ncbi:hypothetical protein [Azospirillum humicireducens]|uniref:hypothetical protein n=1 Tax=Azospirillum humicireducens TaxID=1226968 RepID=UPI0011B23298|nr:hypothetical protein [Azospirillum humicireducens]
MKDLREDTLRYPSASATFLRIFGTVISVVGVIQIVVISGDFIIGTITIIGGLIVFALGSLRKALADIIYELRSVSDARTSNHPAQTEANPPRQMD